MVGQLLKKWNISLTVCSYSTLSNYLPGIHACRPRPWPLNRQENNSSTRQDTKQHDSQRLVLQFDPLSQKVGACCLNQLCNPEKCDMIEWDPNL